MKSENKLPAKNIADTHRHRARLKNFIQIRVCLLCKYAFISGKGANICLDCTDIQRKEWIQRHPYAPNPENRPQPQIFHATVRVMMVRKGMLCSAYRATSNPAIPCPDVDREDFKDMVVKTFSIYPRPIGRKVTNWPPYPHLQFQGFPTGRPQTKVRILA